MTGFDDTKERFTTPEGSLMANLVYKRVSIARQNLVLAEARIEGPVVFEEQAGTSSRLHPLQRPAVGGLLAHARPGDTVHVSEMFRLVRGTQHILDVLAVLHRDRRPAIAADTIGAVRTPYSGGASIAALAPSYLCATSAKPSGKLRMSASPSSGAMTGREEAECRNQR
ncbi:recombinase family protein [Actinomadura miaoliensis]|uniref:Resolvase/invertase-type recombinase catalytic domain-containing protein n=1 Tax=Actinomadura miaoliensis TaxID=430685 RepID=A0ABP7VMT2_9ACTN